MKNDKAYQCCHGNLVARVPLLMKNALPDVEGFEKNEKLDNRHEAEKR